MRRTLGITLACDVGYLLMYMLVTYSFITFSLTYGIACFYSIILSVLRILTHLHTYIIFNGYPKDDLDILHIINKFNTQKINFKKCYVTFGYPSNIILRI